MMFAFAFDECIQSFLLRQLVLKAAGAFRTPFDPTTMVQQEYIVFESDLGLSAGRRRRNITAEVVHRAFEYLVAFFVRLVSYFRIIAEGHFAAICKR